jgi:predicted site-specific integrase-resolvase
MDLKTLARYASVSTKTITRWIKASSDALPAAKRSGKVLVSKQAFDSWMERQSSAGSAEDVSAAVDRILSSL